jgi:hypothetical protein
VGDLREIDRAILRRGAGLGDIGPVRQGLAALVPVVGDEAADGDHADPGRQRDRRRGADLGGRSRRGVPGRAVTLDAEVEDQNVDHRHGEEDQFQSEPEIMII